MKKILLDMKDLSDSKEVYAQRPNPFIAGFIYSIILLLAIALVYSFIGKIEIVATAAGVIRPNDDIGTVASMINGKITDVFYTDGQNVQTGDRLFLIDTSETRILLDSLLNTQKDYTFQRDMTQKFLDGIEAGSNPFSNEPMNDEYPFYIQFRDFDLFIKNTETNSAYDENQVATNIQSIAEQIEMLSYRIAGLTRYKNSVEQNENLVAAYPEYESQYLLYATTMSNLEFDYETKRTNIELDSSPESNAYYLSYYGTQMDGYQKLIDSIKAGHSTFPAGDMSTGKMLYDDYVYNLSEYQRKFENAKDTYYFNLDGGGVGSNKFELLGYDATMLEGYNFYKQSVVNGRDEFVDSKDSVFYRSLYSDYQSKYDALSAAAMSAAEMYETLLADASATESALADALAAKETAEKERDSYKNATLNLINNTLLQIEATIAEKEVGIGTVALDYNISTAEKNMDSAEAAINTYKNRMLGEYNQTISDLRNKLEDLKFSKQSTQSKEELFANLETTYKQSKEQQYYTTVTQINNAIQSMEAELDSAESSLLLNQITRDLHNNNRDENGRPIAVSSAVIAQISSLLNALDSLDTKLDETDYQIQQTRIQ
jgi:hypothetical protein